MPKKPKSFQEIFDLDAERKRTEASRKNGISFSKYLELLREDPRIAQNSPARLREIVLDNGVEEIPESERWLGVSKRYTLFSESLLNLSHKPAFQAEVGALN